MLLGALNEVAPLLIDSAYAEELVGVLDGLARDDILRHSGLAFAMGRVALFRDDHHAARALYTSAAAAADATVSLRARSCWELGCLALADGELEAADLVLQMSTTALGRIAEDTPDILHIRSLIAERRGVRRASLADLRRAIALGDRALTPMTRVLALRNLASLRVQDDPQEAAGLCALALALIDGDLLDRRSHASVENALAYALICEAQLDDALDHARAAAADAARTGHRLIEGYAHFNMCIAFELRGDLAAADAALARAERIAVDGRCDELLGWVRIRHAWLAVKHGDRESARDAIEREFGAGGPSILRTALETLKAILDYGSGRLPRAIAALRALVDTYREEDDYLSTIAVLLWVACAHDAMGDQGSAQAAIAAAVRLGQVRGVCVSPNWWSDELVSVARDRALPSDTAYCRALMTTNTTIGQPVLPTISIRADGNILIAGIPISDALWRSGRSGSRVLRRLTSALASAHPVGLTREEIADLLWPESEGDRAMRNLDSALNDLRKILAVVGGVAVRFEKARYRLQGPKVVLGRNLATDSTEASSRPRVLADTARPQ